MYDASGPVMLDCHLLELCSGRLTQKTFYSHPDSALNFLQNNSDLDPDSTPTAGTTPRPTRSVDVFPAGPTRPPQLPRGTQPATTLDSGLPSLDPHGGRGPRMTPRHQPPCPGGHRMLKSGACIICTTGGVTACVIAHCVLSPSHLSAMLAFAQ